jgi:hypothetical protein
MDYAVTGFLLNSLKPRLGWVLYSLSIITAPLYAAVITGEEAGTGRLTWEWRDSGVSLKLLQLLPDQTRAFYQGRGFSGKQADIIANNCVFQTIFRNDGTTPIDYDLDDWRVSHQGETSALLTRERWSDRWHEHEVGRAARIAMEWALLPTRQHFESGDYNWGMTSFGLPPGSSFDLTLVIHRNDEVITARIPNILCATDQDGP